MKKLIILFLALVGTVCTAENRPLKSWKLRCEGSRKVWKAEVPATVAGVLADSGEFGAEPFRSDNYSRIDRERFDKAWTFSTRFRTGRKAGKRYTLCFDALGYRADIFLNGRLLASSDTTFGVFVRRSYDITPFVRRFLRNSLKVTLHRAVPGDLNHGYVDWNPRPVDESMGMLGPVVLKETAAVRMDDAFVRPDLDCTTLSQADLHIETTLTNLTDAPVSGVLRISYEGGEASVPLTLQPGSTELSFGPQELDILHLDNPRVWWTHDLGTPELYRMSFAFEQDGAVSDGRSVEFGVRSIGRELRDGHSLFSLNGRPILIKGAGWTGELFMRDTPASDALQVSYVKDMGLNCIRFENIWGKDDEIYSLCDREGLLAMVGFSCQWEWEHYCGLPVTRGYGCINDPASEDLAVRYFHDEVLRLRNHPSVFCWLTGSDNVPNPRLEARYMEIYGKYEYRPYICSAGGLSSAFGGPSGMKMSGPYEYVGPEYWYLDTKHGGAFGFNTETGVGLNIPQLPSLERMMAPDSLWPVSADWDYHCTSSAEAMHSTEVLTEVMEHSYGAASTLEEYVAMAHSLDYDATRTMFEAFRCNFPGSTGIVQWMLNSAWPSLYWQLYDYYMVPTAAYYAVRKACEPLQLVYNYKDGAVWGLNETGADAPVSARIRLYGSDSRLLYEHSIDCTLTDNAPVRLERLPERSVPAFLSLSLCDAEGNEIADNFYCLPAKPSAYAWDKANWYITPISEYADMSFVSSLPAADVRLSARRTEDRFEVVLENLSETVSFQNILRCERPDGSLAVPAYWSDNFVSLLPGERKVLLCRVPGGTEGCRITFQGGL